VLNEVVYVRRTPDRPALGLAQALRSRKEASPSPGQDLRQVGVMIKMFSVIFEVHPKQEQFDLYLALAKNLRPALEGIDGFIDNERFESKRRPGWILSHSTWRDEKSVVRWRTVAKHHETQQRGRDEVFQDYHLRVGEVVTPPKGLPLVEQRLDETEVGVGKFATLTEVSPAPDAAGSMAPSELAARLALDREHPALIDHDVFVSIYNARKLVSIAGVVARVWLGRGLQAASP
jgi:heme-degrading monooxygenase HmoA